jgi:GGDEF domain-containing protein
MVIAGESCQLRASIGIAVGSGTSTADALHRAADAAMYQAKRDGGQQWALAPDDAVVPQA